MSRLPLTGRTMKPASLCASAFMVVLLILYLTAVRYVRGQTAGEEYKYYNHDEMTAFLKNVSRNYPDFTRLYSAGKSVQGRDLWVLLVTHRPDEDSLLKPSVKYVANMHGNEAVGRQLMVYLIAHLLTRYHVDPYIRYLLDNTRIHIMPSMNPDGYEISKEGACTGTVGRYNARGVDLNRNFPDHFKKQTKEEQPETAAVRKWIHQIPFVLSGNLHGGAVVASYPYDNSPNAVYYSYSKASVTPDDDVFQHLARVYSFNHAYMYLGTPCSSDRQSFTNGTTNGAAWYPLAGGMQDYNYIWEGCMEVTFEISCCKFPPKHELLRFWDDNRKSLLAFIGEVHKGVRGIVQDENANPVPKAFLKINGRHIGFRTTSKGEYWRVLRPGRYTIEVTAPGYHTARQDFVVLDKQIAVLNVTMKSLYNPPETTFPLPTTSHHHGLTTTTVAPPVSSTTEAPKHEAPKSQLFNSETQNYQGPGPYVPKAELTKSDVPKVDVAKHLTQVTNTQYFVTPTSETPRGRPQSVTTTEVPKRDTLVTPKPITFYTHPPISFRTPDKVQTQSPTTEVPKPITSATPEPVAPHPPVAFRFKFGTHIPPRGIVSGRTRNAAEAKLSSIPRFDQPKFKVPEYGGMQLGIPNPSTSYTEAPRTETTVSTSAKSQPDLRNNQGVDASKLNEEKVTEEQHPGTVKPDAENRKAPTVPVTLLTTLHPEEQKYVIPRFTSLSSHTNGFEAPRLTTPNVQGHEATTPAALNSGTVKPESPGQVTRSPTDQVTGVTFPATGVSQFEDPRTTTLNTDAQRYEAPGVTTQKLDVPTTLDPDVQTYTPPGATTFYPSTEFEQSTVTTRGPSVPLYNVPQDKTPNPGIPGTTTENTEEQGYLAPRLETLNPGVPNAVLSTVNTTQDTKPQVTAVNSGTLEQGAHRSTTLNPEGQRYHTPSLTFNARPGTGRATTVHPDVPKTAINGGTQTYDGTIATQTPAVHKYEAPTTTETNFREGPRDVQTVTAESPGVQTNKALGSATPELTEQNPELQVRRLPSARPVGHSFFSLGVPAPQVPRLSALVPRTHRYFFRPAVQLEPPKQAPQQSGIQYSGGFFSERTPQTHLRIQPPVYEAESPKPKTGLEATNLHQPNFGISGTNVPESQEAPVETTLDRGTPVANGQELHRPNFQISKVPTFGFTEAPITGVGVPPLPSFPNAGPREGVSDVGGTQIEVPTLETLKADVPRPKDITKPNNSLPNDNKALPLPSASIGYIPLPSFAASRAIVPFKK
ncbi:mucin-5AC-like isoform X2 [Ornithodoros turicata]|uniref:mucin-5AC-like isoform X2 n=1 Tax=Ornithodoros turicata TaxID=34597 RepID=UPI00313928E6